MPWERCFGRATDGIRQERYISIISKFSAPTIAFLAFWLAKKLGQDGWILASFFFCEFMDLDFVSVHKHAKKELGQYPAILTSHLVNNPYRIEITEVRSLWMNRLTTSKNSSKFGNIVDFFWFSFLLKPNFSFPWVWNTIKWRIQFEKQRRLFRRRVGNIDNIKHTGTFS